MLRSLDGFLLRRIADRLPVRRNEVFIFIELKNSRANQHPDAGGEETPFEILRMTRVAHETAPERGNRGADIHAHVENRKGGVLALVARLVEVAHHNRDIRLEEAIAQNQCAQPREHQPLG